MVCSVFRAWYWVAFGTISRIIAYNWKFSYLGVETTPPHLLLELKTWKTEGFMGIISPNGETSQLFGVATLRSWKFIDLDA